MPNGILRPRLSYFSNGQQPLGIRDGLVCYLRMEQPTGNAIDWTGRGNTGIASANPPGSAVGKIGNCRTQDGATQWFYINQSADFANLGAFWCSGDVWVPSVPSNNQHTWGQGPSNPANCSFRVVVGNNGFLQGKARDLATTEQSVQDSAPYALAAWVHYDFWFDPILLTINLKVDDRAVVSLAVTGINQVAQANCVVGIGVSNSAIAQPSNPGNVLNGQQDNMGFWRRVPTQQDLDLVRCKGLSFDAYRRAA